MTYNEFRAMNKKMSLEEYEIYAKKNLTETIKNQYKNLSEDQINESVNFIYNSWNSDMNDQSTDLLKNDDNYESLNDEELYNEMKDLDSNKRTVEPEDSLYKDSLALITDLIVVPLLVGENNDHKQ